MDNFNFGSEGKIQFCCTICVSFLLILTVEFEIDLSRILGQGKPTATCLGAVGDVFQLKIYQGEMHLVLCVRDRFFSVVFRVVRDVQKFDVRLVINETPNKRRPVERRSCSD
jgi:hypothetical protein